MAKRRQKRRTHATEPEEATNVPKSMVMKMGDSRRVPTKALSSLVRDFRQIMQPHTAAKLRERKSNKLKDYLVMAGPLGVTHFFIFSQSASGNTTLRIGRTPRGPTLYFRVLEYTLARDILKTQARPHSLNVEELRTPPTLILNGFSADKSSDKEALLTSIFHNMLPSIDVSTTRLKDVHRALLISKDKETDEITMRHYVIQVKNTGSSRAIRKLNAAQQGKRQIPNLRAAADVSDYMYDPGVSESEGEEETFPADREAKTKKAIKLIEVGPRLKLRLVKIEEGLCSGKTIYHASEQRSEKEAARMEQKHREKDALRLKRRREQEENVRRKREEKAAKTSRTKRGIEKAREREEANGDQDGDSGSEYEQDVDTMNDAELEAELAAADSNGSDSEA